MCGGSLPISDREIRKKFEVKIDPQEPTGNDINIPIEFNLRRAPSEKRMYDEILKQWAYGERNMALH